MVRFVSLFHLLRFCISTWPVLHISSMWFTITPSRVKSLFVGLSNSSNFCCQLISLHEGLSCFLKQQDQVSVKLWQFFDLLNFCTFCHLCIQNSPHHPASQWHLFLVSLSKISSICHGSIVCQVSCMVLCTYIQKVWTWFWYW